MPVIQGSAFGKEIDKNELSFETAELVADTTLGSATTDIAFTGLDFDTDGHYRIILYSVGGAASSATDMYVNADFVAANYNNIRIYSNGALGTATANNALVCDGNANNDDFTVIDVMKLTGKKIIAVSFASVRAQTYLFHVLWSWTGTANVTTITLRNTGATGHYAGSRAMIYKVTQ